MSAPTATFHATIVAAEGNMILIRLYGSLRDRQLRMGAHNLLAARRSRRPRERDGRAPPVGPPRPSPTPFAAEDAALPSSSPESTLPAPTARSAACCARELSR